MDSGDLADPIALGSEFSRLFEPVATAAPLPLAKAA
jgi:hypothetical protein